MNISEKSLSIVLFLQRALVAIALGFLATGEALHLNAFIQNGIDIGLPYAAQICPTVVILTIAASVLLLLGLFTKVSSVILALTVMFSGFFFFAGMFNRVNIVGVLLALALLVGFMIIGAGTFSLDAYLAKRKIENNKRLTFR